MADAFDCTSRTSERLRHRFVAVGFEAALDHGNRGSYRARALDGVAEAHLIALACGDAPQGRNLLDGSLVGRSDGCLGLCGVLRKIYRIRHVRIRQRRTRKDFAEIIRELSDELYPEVDKIVLVLDQLNTHNTASLYEAFEPAEAKPLADRLEIHHTPKHGSWLNMAEIELSILSRQCMNDYFASRQQLAARIAPWERSRNNRQAGIDWRFTTADARIKLKKLYPII